MPLKMDLYIKITSLSGRGRKFDFAIGFHIEPFSSRNPLSDSFFISLFIGAFIIMFPFGCLRLRFRTDLAGEILSNPLLPMRVPKNSACPFKALVMNVFSSDNFKSKELRNSFISNFKLLANLKLPHNPMTQSSAYLTYSTLMYSGFGQVDLVFLRIFKLFKYSVLTPSVSNPAFLFFIHLRFRLIIRLDNFL